MVHLPSAATGAVAVVEIRHHGDPLGAALLDREPVDPDLDVLDLVEISVLLAFRLQSPAGPFPRNGEEEWQVPRKGECLEVAVAAAMAAPSYSL